MSSTTLSGMPSSSISPSPAATSAPPSGTAGGGGPTSSPLLFFVALGFGVVFTNLWIIVGVKYCFRYNQRNRRALHDENGEPIDMTAMPRTHRRRREKKLMTMDEVNERFPTLKYKAWMTARAEEGLSTAGGVAAPSGSRPASLRTVDGVIEGSKMSHDAQRPVTPAPKQSTDEPGKDNSPESTNKSSPEIGIGEMPQSPTQAAENKHIVTDTAETKDGTAAVGTVISASTENMDDDMDEDDQIQMAVPTEIMAMAAGDSCAICIDQLEDDEDVRGLTCGHAFHAHCLDPWLTSRRACCPLCKADYYIPKPRPEGEAAAEADQQERSHRQGGSRMDMPHPPQYTYQRHGRGRILFPSRFMARGLQGNSREQGGFASRFARPQRVARPQPQPSTQPQEIPPPEGQQSNSWRTRMGSMVPNVTAPSFMRRSNPNNNNSNNTTTEAAATAGAPDIHHDTDTTPSQLEAGRQ